MRTKHHIMWSACLRLYMIVSYEDWLWDDLFQGLLLNLSSQTWKETSRGKIMASSDPNLSSPTPTVDQQLKKLDDLLLNPNPMADAIIDLEKEGKRIYTSRWLLDNISDTFAKSFTANTDGDGTMKMKLPNVCLEAALEFMHWVMPSTRQAVTGKSIQWRHNGSDSVSNHQPHDRFLVNSDADQRKHQSSAWLAFVRGIHRGPVNSPHKWPATRKIFPFDDVIMYILNRLTHCGRLTPHSVMMSHTSLKSHGI